MKTITRVGLVLVTIISLSIPAFASIDQNLKYKQRNSEVQELQEFLIDRGFLNGSSSGFFGLLTLRAVKAYQKSVNLPPTGFVGLMSRNKINAEIAQDTASSTQAEINETGTITPVTSKQKTTDKPVAVTQSVFDVCKNIEGIQTAVPSGMIANAEGSCFMQVMVIYNNQSQSSQSNTNKTEPLPTCTLVAENPTTTNQGQPKIKVSWTSQNATAGKLTTTIYDRLTTTDINSVPSGLGFMEFNGHQIPQDTEGKRAIFNVVFTGTGGEVKCETSLLVTYPELIAPTIIALPQYQDIFYLGSQEIKLPIFKISPTSYGGANAIGWKNINLTLISDNPLITRENIEVDATNGREHGLRIKENGDVELVGGEGVLTFKFLGANQAGKIKIIVNSATFSGTNKTVSAKGFPIESKTIEIR